MEQASHNKIASFIWTIADDVTGQVDVRAAAAGLPEIEPAAAQADSADDDPEFDDSEVAA